MSNCTMPDKKNKIVNDVINEVFPRSFIKAVNDFIDFSETNYVTVWIVFPV